MVEQVGRNQKLVIAIGGDLDAPFYLDPNTVQLNELLHSLAAHLDYRVPPVSVRCAFGSLNQLNTAWSPTRNVRATTVML